LDAARLVAKRGYTNIMVFTEGIPAWIKAGYAINSPSPIKGAAVPAIDSARLHASLNDFLVVDIRPESAYDLGYLPGSHAMPLAYLSMLSVELPKNRKLVVVDHSGNQCQIAARWLLSKGFGDVCWLKGGLVGYKKAGFELER